jgi:RNA polymerase sigma factor (sigma-70 family)
VSQESTAEVPTRAEIADIAAFIRTVADELLAYFARRVTPHEDAADCLAETLLVLWRRRERLPTEHGERRAWSYGIAHRVLAAHRRKALRQLSLADRLRDELRYQPVAAHSSDNEAIAALSALSARDQELVMLIVWEGLSVTEAATVIGIRADAARARYSRARRTLRANLGAL